MTFQKNYDMDVTVTIKKGEQIMENLEVKLLRLDADIDDAEAMVKDLKAEREIIEKQIIEAWSETGTTKTTINGRTVYIKRSLQLSPIEGREAVIAALESAGMDEYLKEDYNTNSLKSYITGVANDLKADLGMEPSVEEIRKALPEELALAMDLFEKYQIVTRNG